MHAHPFWQYEWVLSGQAVAEVSDHRHILHAGEGLLIPPHCRHSFTYERNGTAWISVKFQTAGGSDKHADGLLPHHPAARPLGAAIASCVGSGGVLSPALAPLLSGLLALYQRRSEPSSDPITQIMARVRSEPLTGWRVDTLAAAVGLSPGHCTTRFRAKTGVALKTWLDQQRAESCVQLLRFADANMGAIAEQAGFADIFTFSRFIKRVTGSPPSQHRHA